MKGFANGIGGVCVCMLAIMGTIMCGFFLGVEETVSTSTQYSLAADTTGLFDTQESKRYIDYNPAANWTGYRVTGSTDDVTGGIEYSTSAKINTYPIAVSDTLLDTNLRNLSKATGYADPPGNLQTDGVDLVIISDDVVRMTDQTSYISWPRVSTIKQQLETWGNEEGATKIEMDLVYTDSTGTIRSYAAPSSAWHLESVRTNPSGSWANYANYMMLSYTEYSKVVKLSIDLNTDTVTGLDADGNERFRSSTGNTTISYAQLTAATGFPKTEWAGDVVEPGNLNTTYWYQTTSPTYMDVSKGVRVSNGAGTWGNAYSTWSNGYQCGEIDILMKWYPGETNELKFTVPVNFSESTYSTGYSKTIDLKMMLRYTQTSGRNYSLQIWSGNGGYDSQYSFGAGDFSKGILIKMDFTGDSLKVYGVTAMKSFQDYTLTDAPLKEFSGYFSSVGNFTTQVTPGTISAEKIDFTAIESLDGSSPSPYMGVVATTVYMGDTVLMMNSPLINPGNLWPANFNWEMRFSSFAIIGDSLTINPGVGTWQVEDGKLIIDGVGHTLQDLRVRASYDTIGGVTGWHVWLVFAQENPVKPIYVGSTTNDNGPAIKWSGFWYFTSSYYTGTEVSTSGYTLDFQHFIFDSNAAILCYLGLLIMGTIILKRVSGLGAYDMIVLVFAGVCGFVLMA